MNSLPNAYHNWREKQGALSMSLYDLLRFKTDEQLVDLQEEVIGHLAAEKLVHGKSMTYGNFAFALGIIEGLFYVRDKGHLVHASRSESSL